MEALETIRYTLETFADSNELKRTKTYYNNNKEKFSHRQINNDSRKFTLRITVPDGPFRSQNVDVDMRDNNPNYLSCSCGRNFRYSPCVHTLETYHYLKEHQEALVNDYFKHSFSRLKKIFASDDVSKQQLLNLEVSMKFVSEYYHNWEINLKIGTKKLYSIKSKMKAFFDAYTSSLHHVYKIGKDLEYDNKTFRFNTEDQAIIEYFEPRYYSRHMSYSEINILNSKEIKQFINILKDKSFTIEIDDNSFVVDRIEEDFNLKSTLKKDSDNQYSFSFNLENFYPLTDDFEYVISNNRLYHLNQKQRNVIRDIMENTRGNDITFKEEELPTFASTFLPKLKNVTKEITADKELEEYVQIESPVNRIYYDYKRGKLTAEVKYFYQKQNQEIPLNSKINITRDFEKEREAVDYLENNDFKYNEKKEIYEIDDIDKQGLFLENQIGNIPLGYEFFVSSAVKKIDLVSTPSISSGLSLGSDEWLRCDVKFGDYSLDDLKDIITSVKENKKYTKLKDGTIIKLDNNQEVEDFYELLEDFDIDYKKLDDLNIKIPKYKALYLNNYVEKENYINIDRADTFKEFIDKFNEYKNTKIKFIDVNDKKLRDYQIIGVNFLTSLDKCGFGGILADEMGLGKTFQAITYIKHKLKENKNSKFLIVVPTSLLYNWKNEFKIYAPSIEVLLMNQLPSIRKEMFNEIGNYNVVVTSYGLLRQDIEEYMNIEFDTCIIDEAQTIKNIHAGITKSLKLINAHTKFALTGTPIENSLLELYSIFDFLMPGYFSTLNKFNERFQKPIIKEDSKERLDLLNMAVAPFILRRKKSDVLKDLPDKLEEKIMIDMNDEQKKVYYAHLQLAKKEIQEEMDKNGFNKSQIKILSILTRLRQICIDPALFVEDYKGGSAKIDAILDFLESAKEAGHKVLLFSQFTSALHILERKFHERGISYYYIDGAVKSKDRLDMVNKFNEDDTDVFLISLKAGGTGLNLTGADTVIHLDFWWNPAVENQATDRAHRIGQKKVVQVVKIVCQGTIEERVLELQQKKKKLSDGILEHEDRDKAVLSKLTEKDIRNLLEMD